jgi:hypothetical protein
VLGNVLDLLLYLAILGALSATPLILWLMGVIILGQRRD